jgi:cell division protein FtsL
MKAWMEQKDLLRVEGQIYKLNRQIMKAEKDIKDLKEKRAGIAKDHGLSLRPYNGCTGK